MVDEKGLIELGKDLADLGMNFDDVSKRVKDLPEGNKRYIFAGFSSAMINSNAADSYLAAKESGDSGLLKNSLKKLLDGDLRAATRIAMSSEDIELMEAITEEANKKNDTLTVELIKNRLREVKMKSISKILG